MNLPDHQVLFQGISERLREEVTQHVSVLLSSECTTVKHTIEQLTSQFLRQSTVPLDSQVIKLYEQYDEWLQPKTL